MSKLVPGLTLITVKIYELYGHALESDSFGFKTTTEELIGTYLTKEGAERAKQGYESLRKDHPHLNFCARINESCVIFDEVKRVYYTVANGPLVLNPFIPKSRVDEREERERLVLGSLTKEQREILSQMSKEDILNK